MDIQEEVPFTVLGNQGAQICIFERTRFEHFRFCSLYIYNLPSSLRGFNEHRIIRTITIRKPSDMFDHSITWKTLHHHQTREEAVLHPHSSWIWKSFGFNWEHCPLYQWAFELFENSNLNITFSVRTLTQLRECI